MKHTDRCTHKSHELLLPILARILAQLVGSPDLSKRVDRLPLAGRPLKGITDQFSKRLRIAILSWEYIIAFLLSSDHLCQRISNQGWHFRAVTAILRPRCSVDSLESRPLVLTQRYHFDAFHTSSHP